MTQSNSCLPVILDRCLCLAVFLSAFYLSNIISLSYCDTSLVFHRGLKCTFCCIPTLSYLLRTYLQSRVDQRLSCFHGSTPPFAVTTAVGLKQITATLYRCSPFLDLELVIFLFLPLRRRNRSAATPATIERGRSTRPWQWSSRTRT